LHKAQKIKPSNCGLPVFSSTRLSPKIELSDFCLTPTGTQLYVSVALAPATFTRGRFFRFRTPLPQIGPKAFAMRADNGREKGCG
jgi:hypothetical protein